MGVLKEGTTTICWSVVTKQDEEQEREAPVWQKYNAVTGSSSSEEDILTKSFLRKYIFFARNRMTPKVRRSTGRGLYGPELQLVLLFVPVFVTYYYSSFPPQLTEEAQVEIADMYKDLRQKEVRERGTGGRGSSRRDGCSQSVRAIS